MSNTTNRIKSGIVVIIGRPSAGKSTFLNAVCGHKVSIVSHIPQTTRNIIRGIVSNKQGQIVFFDTPGYHLSEKKLNKRLQHITEKSLADADAILYLIDATRPIQEEEEAIMNLLLPYQHKLCIAINKIDLPNAATGMITLLLSSILQKIPRNKIFTISALKKTNLNTILNELFMLLPNGEYLYPENFYTDQAVEFRISEIIREQAILHTREELPHAIYVRIDNAQLSKNQKRLTVRASICVERKSQIPILIGENAKTIKSIREAAQKQARNIFPYFVQLSLYVRLDKNWRQKDSLLNQLY